MNNDLFMLLMTDGPKLYSAIKNRDWKTGLDVVIDVLNFVKNTWGNKPVIDNIHSDIVPAMVVGSVKMGAFGGWFRSHMENVLFALLGGFGLSKDEALQKIGDGSIIQWVIDHAPQILELVKTILAIIAAFA